jgi:two-component system phosphate regulon sensor histidine kinase PhoR
MMNWLLGFLLLASMLALGWLAWRLISLRGRLEHLTGIVRQAAEKRLSAPVLPEDVNGLEELPVAIQALGEAWREQMSGLEAERARLAAVLDQMTDGVLIADAHGRVQFANPAAAKIFDDDHAGLLGRSVAEVLRHHQLIEAWQRSQMEGEVQSESVEVPAHRQFLQLVVMPDQHIPGGSLLLIQDLTRVRRLETVRRDFISNLSHELRTPLASLKALTETLQEGALDDPPAAHRFLGRIQTEVDALTQMATELLELSRIESGQVPLELRKIAPCDLVNSAAERMRMQVERAGLNLQVECSPDLPTIRADAPRLEQVLVNLIHNAAKFTRPGGEVTLFADAVPGAEAGPDVVRFAVRDSGVGIPADDLPRIFERFYKTDRARSSGGTGLGLSIARHLVEAHGGKIWAESIEGQGSTFYFTIPHA